VFGAVGSDSTSSSASSSSFSSAPACGPIG
jgi:hypothetical protein